MHKLPNLYEKLLLRDNQRNLMPKINPLCHYHNSKMYAIIIIYQVIKLLPKHIRPNPNGDVDDPN